MSKSGVPPKLSFFTWEAVWGKVSTLDQLQRRGWTFAKRCYLCMECEETMDHLLLHCAKTIVSLFSLFSTTWMISESVRDILISRKSVLKDKERRKVWRVGPSCLFLLCGRGGTG